MPRGIRFTPFRFHAAPPQLSRPHKQVGLPTLRAQHAEVGRPFVVAQETVLHAHAVQLGLEFDDLLQGVVGDGRWNRPSIDHERRHLIDAEIRRQFY